MSHLINELTNIADQFHHNNNMCSDSQRLNGSFKMIEWRMVTLLSAVLFIYMETVKKKFHL